MDPYTSGLGPPPRGRGFTRVYDMRRCDARLEGEGVDSVCSLTAALNAARPGCGEIRRILTSSQFRPRLPGDSRAKFSVGGCGCRFDQVGESVEQGGTLAEGFGGF